MALITEHDIEGSCRIGFIVCLADQENRGVKELVKKIVKLEWHKLLESAGVEWRVE